MALEGWRKQVREGTGRLLRLYTHGNTATFDYMRNGHGSRE